MLSAGAEPLAGWLGFDSVTERRLGERMLAATLRDGTRAIALLVTSWGEPFDPLWREAVTESVQRRAPSCLLFNGTHLRLLDARRLFTRRYVEFDLDQALDDPLTFSALWTVLNADPLQDLIDASDRHASGVRRSLKGGVLAASADILAALVGPNPAKPATPEHLDAAFEQALTIVYRIVFLLFAEARALVPVWHPVYRDSYSLDALRAAIERPHGAIGLWDALRAIARLAHAGCRAGDLRVTPFNGRLFAPARTPLAERRNLDDAAARRAMLALSTRPAVDGAGREPIAYRDLGVEQLGAVYETLLDYRPAADGADTIGPATSARARLRPELRAGSGLRKATGTFYTPQPIAEYVVRRTLGPLVRDADPERILQLRVVDPSMGSGAFLVAACRFLASAYEAALVRTGGCHARDIGESGRAAIRRSVAERCLYGVDLNPMAVQLARLSIWLTTLAGDRPLSFLDHRLHVGNSLLGAWVAALARAPAVRRRRPGTADVRGPSLFDGWNVRDALREALPVRFSMESVPNDTLEQVRDKERAFATMNARGAGLRRWRTVADLWCASWLAGDRVPAQAFGALSDAVLGGTGALSAQLAGEYLCAAEQIAKTHRFFHWELEYPEVFFAADGTRLANVGFDAVLGNPPWDMIRAGSHAARDDDPGRVLRFTRDAGIYEAQSDGHANCYQLFCERAVSLTRAGGRIGLVVPAGLVMDAGSASLRRFLFSRCDVDALVGLENRRGVFPIHRSIRFLLMTASAGPPTSSVSCRFGVDDPAELEVVGDEPADTLPWFQLRLPTPLVERLSGGDLTIPWLRTPTDLAIVERAAALFPPLGDDRGWAARFGRELNATEDRPLFREAGTHSNGGAGLPVVEGKQIEPFGVDLTSSRWTMRTLDAGERLRDGRHLRPRLAYRDVAGPENRLTLIAAVLPPGCVSTHTIFCLRTPLRLSDQQLLCGLFNSFVLNFLVRLRVSTHVTTAIVERLPVPVRDHAPHTAREIAALARVLSRRRHPVAYARLQARVAALYQLTSDEFAYVLSTFPLVPEEVRRAAFEAFAQGLTTSSQAPLE